jgi:hypothetical protein
MHLTFTYFSLVVQHDRRNTRSSAEQKPGLAVYNIIFRRRRKCVSADAGSQGNREPARGFRILIILVVHYWKDVSCQLHTSSCVFLTGDTAPVSSAAVVGMVMETESISQLHCKIIMLNFVHCLFHLYTAWYFGSWTSLLSVIMYEKKEEKCTSSWLVTLARPDHVTVKLS